MNKEKMIIRIMKLHNLKKEELREFTKPQLKILLDDEEMASEIERAERESLKTSSNAT